MVSNIQSDPGRLSNSWVNIVIQDGCPDMEGEKKEGKNYYRRFWYKFYR